MFNLSHNPSTIKKKSDISQSLSTYLTSIPVI